MPGEEFRIAVHRIIGAMNEGSLDDLDELYAVNVVCHRPPYPDIKDLKGLKELGTNWLRSYPECQFTIERVIVEGNIAAAQLSYRGTHASTGKQVSGPGCTVYQFEGGKVVEEWDHWDELGFHQQLGYKLVAPQESGEQ